MPRKVEKISDELLLSNGVYDKDPLLPLSARQVALMTDLSVDQLKERRRTRPPKPPLAFNRGDDADKTRAIWYPLGEVLDYRHQRLARPLPATVIRPAIATFTELMARGTSDDEWPFAQTTAGMPVDFFLSLTMGEQIDSEGEVGWQSMQAYLVDLGEWSARQRAGAEKRKLDKGLEQPRTATARCSKCGRPLADNHRCRF